MGSSTSRVLTNSQESTEESTTPKSPFEIILEVAVTIPGRALGAVVRNLNSREVEAAALSRQCWGDDQPLAQHYLNVIAEALEELDAS